ncbi:PREDICTED: protein SSX4-like [Miniopterus natalensis]|uniref:protein SSX4-like n=1 Tax=Miniopterus natalensis TaxID=291302 RepID=UPI0007A6F82F|nr:PREDICTED: protein SSX4-like [Miniopterus natalensis]
MNKGSSLDNNPMEDSQNSEEKCKAFRDICKYSSVEEWAKLGNSEKITYVYVKRNSDTMTGLGLMAKLPDFMRPKNRTTESPEHDSDEARNPGNQDENPQEASNEQLRKHQKVMAKNLSREENDLKPLPVIPDSELAQKHLCPSGNASVSGQQIEKSAAPCTEETEVCARELQENECILEYEDISDSEEDNLCKPPFIPALHPCKTHS